jgi:hypothetical protein
MRKFKSKLSSYIHLLNFQERSALPLRKEYAVATINNEHKDFKKAVLVCLSNFKILYMSSAAVRPFISLSCT